jgi:hypothetical protein
VRHDRPLPAVRDRAIRRGSHLARAETNGRCADRRRDADADTYTARVRVYGDEYDDPFDWAKLYLRGKMSVTDPCRVFVGFALVSFSLMSDDARAQVTEFIDGIVDAASPAGIATGVDGTDRSTGIAGNSFARATTDVLGDLIFDADFEGNRNGGISCNTALVLGGDTTYSADTTTAPNWMNSFGPASSSSNDVVYMFVAGADVAGSIIPTASNYPFAMYLIPSCGESGTEPSPIGATATIGRGIDLLASGVTSGNTYYLAVTGIPAGGPGANGTLNFTTPSSIAIAPKF